MKKLALVAVLALALTGCTAGAESAPAATSASPVSAEAVPAVESATPTATSPEYEECIANRKASDKEIGVTFDEGFAHMVCGDMEDVYQQIDEEVGGMVADSPLWQCWLDLEETRPELFASADPEIYGNDPAVVAVCGGK